MEAISRPPGKGSGEGTTALKGRQIGREARKIWGCQKFVRTTEKVGGPSGILSPRSAFIDERRKKGYKDIIDSGHQLRAEKRRSPLQSINPSFTSGSKNDSSGGRSRPLRYTISNVSLSSLSKRSWLESIGQ